MGPTRSTNLPQGNVQIGATRQKGQLPREGPVLQVLLGKSPGRGCQNGNWRATEQGKARVGSQG